jgi:hypothetical protein
MQDFKSFISTLLFEIATSVSYPSFAPEERGKSGFKR